MKLHPSIFTALPLLWACSNPKPQFSHHSQNTCIAWNQDTANPIHLALTKSNHFFYSITITDSGSKREEYFSGSYLDRGDTIFLHYNNNGVPEHFTNFLVKEMQGNYFIQYFTNSSSRIFLSILKIRKLHAGKTL